MVDSFAFPAASQSLEMRRFRDGSWPVPGNMGRCSDTHRAELVRVVFQRASIVLQR